jgi:ribonuclease Z
MATLHLLGTGSANSTPDRTTTMLAVHDNGSTILVDCGGDVVQRLLAAGLPVGSIEAMIVTHEHPDHVSGFPLFVEKLWLEKRVLPIRVCGIRPAIDQARRCWEAFNTSMWSGIPEIEWIEVDIREGAPVMSDSNWKITASPGVHGAPVVGLRIRSKSSGGVVAYSCDTEPCDSIQRLASGADILVHEANGEGKGHASAEQAAHVAKAAEVGRLVLVHLPAHASQRDVDAASTVFEPTELGEDLARFEF